MAELKEDPTQDQEVDSDDDDYDEDEIEQLQYKVLLFMCGVSFLFLLHLILTPLLPNETRLSFLVMVQ